VCGIVGFLGRSERTPLERMTDVLSHRGPDGRGTFYSALGNGGPAVGLGHRRLSVIDLSDAGRQPMATADGRYWITFNGEIYNYRELRQELAAAGVHFASKTDTEALLYGYARWGSGVLQRLNGIFAFAIWDAVERELFLARDHTGIKPLYYTRSDGVFLFASEVKALFQFPGVRRALDRRGLHEYLSFLWVPDPRTVFEGVFKLPAGHWASVKDGQLSLQQWWDCTRLEVDATRPAQVWIDEVRSLLEAAVHRQLVSDVPLGAFLSGGVDSSAVVALMARRRGRPSTYTVGFTREDLRYEIVDDDLRFAQLVARRFETDSHEIILRPDVMQVLPRVIWHMDEPVADPAAISAYLICREAKQTLTVMLNGQGADEIFGGYPRHQAVRYAEYYNRLPGPVRRSLVPALLGSLRAAGPGRLTTLVRNAKKLTRSAGLGFHERYLGYLTHFHHDQKLELYTPELRQELAGVDANEVLLGHLGRAQGRSPLWQMGYLDLKTFLPSLNLTYTDKMSMAHGVEVRVPFLDPHLVEAAFRMPDSLKIRGGQSKYVLKSACRGLLPEPVLARRKAGFTAPIRGWLQRDLRSLVDELLSPETITRRGLFSPSAVRQLVREHRDGREDNAWKVFQLVTLELWSRTFLDGTGDAPLEIAPSLATRAGSGAR